jgi:hypothetical protein
MNRGNIVTYRYFLEVSVVLVLISCSPVRSILPLHKGQSAVSVSLGGPITQVGAIDAPLPFLCVGYDYGLLEKTDLEAGVNITEAVFGIGNMQAGLNWRPLPALTWRPGFIVSPKLYVMSNFKPGGFRLYPDLGITAFWELPKRRYYYLGMDNWFEPNHIRDDGAVQGRHWLIAPFLGVDFGSERWRFQTEMKLYAPNVGNQGRPVKNIGAGRKGIFGVFAGVSRYFGN